MLNTYAAFYEGGSDFIEAPSLYAAKLAAIAKFRVPKSKTGLLAITLVQIGDKPISETTFPDAGYF